jgi:type-IV secretion system protein TraC
MNHFSKREQSLAEELPYWEFYDRPLAHVVLADGSLVGGLRVGLLDTECLDDQEINQLALGLRSALNSVSEGVTLQFVMEVTSDYAQLIKDHGGVSNDCAHEVLKTLASERLGNLESAQENGDLYRPELTVFVKTRPVGMAKKPFWKRQEWFDVAAQQAYKETLDVLAQNLQSLKGSFTGLGFDVEEVSKDDTISQVYRFLCPKRSKNERPPEVVSNNIGLESQSPRERLCFGDLVLGFDQFTLDAHYHRVISLKTLPETTYAGQFAGFLKFPFHYVLTLTVDVPDQSKELTLLQQKRRMAHSMSVTHGGRASDLESETKLSSTEELLRELLGTGQRIYSAQLAITLRAPNSEQGHKRLNGQVREVLARLRALNGAEGLEESVGSWKVTKNNLPAAPLKLERPKKMKTNNLADFLPVYGPRIGDSNPAIVLKNRMNGLVSYDPFDPSLPNYNCLVTGSSGAGKSFLNNCILLQEMARGLKVFIIDIGGSYRKITETLGGQYFDVNLSDAKKINPFDLLDPKQEPSDQKIKSLLAIIETMVADEGKSRISKLDRAILEKAILDLYTLKRKTNAVPILSDLAEFLRKTNEPSMVPIAKMLSLWTGQSPYGRMLDGQGKLTTSASICTFDLKGLSNYPDLQSVMILILTDFILGQVESNRSVRKRIILDEAWELLKSDACAGFMEYCARTLRKTGSGITFITQGVEEIAASPIGSAILNNTATKFVLLQRGDTDTLQSVLKLNSQELALIHSLRQKKGEFSEGFMIEGDHRQVIRVCPTPKEYWLATSDSQDNTYLDSLRQSVRNLWDAIKEASINYPFGFAQGKR